MKYYFAPMEGITGYLYRQVHREFFPGTDRYFSPFLVPHTSKNFNGREKNDILPENNQEINLVPQILTNQAKDFIRVSRALSEYGYREVNLNLGCPSKTVVTKDKGAGFLAYPNRIDHFLEEVFEQLDMEVSVKTRIGMEDPEEFEMLLGVFNKYPIKELIVHPRLQTDYYKKPVHPDSFELAVTKSKNPLCYNGDLFTMEDVKKWSLRFPQIDAVMFGRGLLANPSLIGRLKGEAPLTKEHLKAFHDRLCRKYEEQKIGDRNVLFKMKELWFYMIALFPDSKKLEKKIRKAQTMKAYRDAVRALFEQADFAPDAGYRG